MSGSHVLRAVGGPGPGRPRRAALAVAVAAGALAVAVPSSALPATGASTPAKDAFTGSVTAVTGSLHGERGSVAITIQFAGGPLPATLTIRPRTCPKGHRCVEVSGRLRGTFSLNGPRIPDVGASYAIRASGTIAPLGHAVATGTVSGTGFIAHGRETLDLKLTGASATITIDAQSRLVPGFTSP
ncbi:MAG TPA: hypothetical protein VG165_10740 [Solirubrobacteraceae bacterium]|jgi:hypothetical protein|nr:hypothetical protein [Solirubrobacteraceae bacterium]